MQKIWGDVTKDFVTKLQAGDQIQLKSQFNIYSCDQNVLLCLPGWLNFE